MPAAPSKAAAGALEAIFNDRPCVISEPSATSPFLTLCFSPASLVASCHKRKLLTRLAARLARGLLP